MSSNIIPTLRKWHERAHRDILDATAELSDRELFWKASDEGVPVAWHMWHIARFADITQSAFTDTEQAWHAQGIAKSWGFDPDRLGLLEGGTGMDQAYAAGIEWPAGREFRSYVETAFETAISATKQVTEANFDERVPRIPDVPAVVLTYGNILTRFVWHPGCHLGNIETLLGLQSRLAVAS